MNIKEKIDLFGFSEEESKKAWKFSASLAFVSGEEIITALDTLAELGLQIRYAREIKVVLNEIRKLKNNYNFANDSHEVDMYEQDLNRISNNNNGLDFHRRKLYCEQNGIEYRDEKGKYKKFLFKEALFRDITNGVEVEHEVKNEQEPYVPASELMAEPQSEISASDNDANLSIQDLDIPEDPDHIDIKDYMQADKDMDKIDAQTTTFAQIRSDLEKQLRELDDLRNQNEMDNNVIPFSDIEVESYGIGRGGRAA